MRVKIVNLKALIDTQEIMIHADNLKDYALINDGYSFVKNGCANDDIKADGLYKRVVISPNKAYGTYVPLHTKSEYLKALEDIYNEIGVGNMEDVALRRIEIAIDSEMDFHTNFKKILFLFELVTFGDKKSDKWYTTNLKTLKNNTIKNKGRSVEVCFYDKAEESKGQHYANTRFEFRFKRVSDKDVVVHMNKIKDMAECMTEALELLEIDMAERIINLWNVEKDSVKSFSEFVRTYSRFFYTINILKSVYKVSGLKGGYNKWLEKFRATNQSVNLEFYSKTDIKEFQKEVKKALKYYIKN